MGGAPNPANHSAAGAQKNSQEVGQSKNSAAAPPPRDQCTYSLTGREVPLSKTWREATRLTGTTTGLDTAIQGYLTCTMIEDSFPSSLPRRNNVRSPLEVPLECPSRQPLKYLPLYLRPLATRDLRHALAPPMRLWQRLQVRDRP